MLSMLKDSKVEEDEVIDFINNRSSSLKLQKELAKLQLEWYLKSNQEELKNKELSGKLLKIGFELLGIQGKGGFGRVF